MGVDAENFLESIYDSVIESNSTQIESEVRNKNNDDIESDKKNNFHESVGKVEVDEDRRIIEAMIQPCIEKILAEIYKEALHRKSESDLLARYYH